MANHIERHPGAQPSSFAIGFTAFAGLMLVLVGDSGQRRHWLIVPPRSITVWKRKRAAIASRPSSNLPTIKLLSPQRCHLA